MGTRSPSALLVAFPLLAAAWLACREYGAVESDSVPDAGDAGAGFDASFDAPADARADGASVDGCDHQSPFGAPVLVGGVNTAGDETTATLSPDEKKIYFARNQPDAGAQRDIFVATRASVTAPFGPATELASVNSPADDDHASVTADGLQLVLHSNRNGVYDTYRSKRATTNVLFPTPSVLFGTPEAELDPFVAPDGTGIYYVKAVGPEFRIFFSADDGSGTFAGIPVPLTHLGIAGSNEVHPVVRADGLELFYASDRNDGAVLDVWHATRASTSSVFGTPKRLDALRTDGRDVPAWISPDGCRLYVSSDRPGGVGGQDVWMASRAK